MVRRVALFSLLFGSLAAAQEPRPATDPEWTPVGVSVSKPDPDGDEPAVRAYGGGTTLTAQLRLPGRHILTMAPTHTVIDAFTDNRGTNLFNAPQVRLNVARATATEPAANGKAIRVVFRGAGYPAAGATKLRVRGAVGVVVGKDEKTVERKDASLKKGIDLGFGTIKAADRDAGFGAGTSATYKGSRPLKQITFLDDGGDEIAPNPQTRLLSSLRDREGRVHGQLLLVAGEARPLHRPGDVLRPDRGRLRAGRVGGRARVVVGVRRQHTRYRYTPARRVTS
ncbi:MAG: hypothetical protein U0804_08820 [Gemmataceae bacterium]